MPINDLVDFRYVMVMLLAGTLRHILQVLLLVQRDFYRARICIHTLKRESIMHACLEEGRIQGEVDALLDSIVLCERINAILLQVR